MSRSRLTLLAVALLACTGPSNASGWDHPAPQLTATLQWSFGGHSTRKAGAEALSAALTLSPGQVAAVPLLHWQRQENRDAAWRLLGLPLNPPGGALSANDDGSNALLLPALVLAGGIAVALMVDSAGKAAKRQQR